MLHGWQRILADRISDIFFEWLSGRESTWGEIYCSSGNSINILQTDSQQRCDYRNVVVVCFWNHRHSGSNLGRNDNESSVIADSDKDANESHQSRFSWLKLLIAVPGRIIVSCSDEQIRFKQWRGERGGWKGRTGQLSGWLFQCCVNSQASKVNRLRSLPSFPPSLSPFPFTPIHLFSQPQHATALLCDLWDRWSEKWKGRILWRKGGGTQSKLSLPWFWHLAV